MALLPTSVPTNISTVPRYEDQNNTNDSQCPNSETKDWHATVLPVYILFITVLGILLNVFVLMVFCFHKKACTVAEIYLSNLAAADLILMVFLPFWAVYAAQKFSWPFSSPMCQLVTLSITMNTYCSIYFLVLVSIDRYIVLVHPLSRSRLHKPKYAKLGCLLVWCFGLLLSIPTLVYRKVEHVLGYGNLCFLSYPNNTVKELFGWMTVIFSFIIPISIISYCTLKIIQALNNKSIEGLNTQKREQKATTLVLVVLLAFMICWIPFHVVKILRMTLSGCTAISILNTCINIFMYIAFFNSVLNPILYVIVGSNFRKKVRELFKQRSTMTLNTMSTRSTLVRSVKTEHVSG